LGIGFKILGNFLDAEGADVFSLYAGSPTTGFFNGNRMLPTESNYWARLDFAIGYVLSPPRFRPDLTGG